MSQRRHLGPYIAQKKMFSIKDFFGKCDQIRTFWSHLLKIYEHMPLNAAQKFKIKNK